jgi:NDP-sugar pyrophosphorylase family protein
MAGAGSRFAQEGYKDPKPLIPIHASPLIKLVIDNLRPAEPHRFIFICQQTHVKFYDLRKKLSSSAPNCIIVEINGLSNGLSYLCD